MKAHTYSLRMLIFLDGGFAKFVVFGCHFELIVFSLREDSWIISSFFISYCFFKLFVVMFPNSLFFIQYSLFLIPYSSFPNFFSFDVNSIVEYFVICRLC